MPRVSSKSKGAGNRLTAPLELGDLRRVTPVSRVFGLDRGLPVDRYYIERFLAREAECIHGRVLEIGDDVYTRRFGGDRVAHIDVLHAPPGTRKATIVADLADGHGIPRTAFDCIICTQTLHCIYDMAAAIRTLHRALVPGGVLLATLPGISQISRYDMQRWGDYWRVTSAAARRLFEAVFSPESVAVEAHGNVLTAVAFLHGLAAEELTQDELDYPDADYELLITAKAVKP